MMKHSLYLKFILAYMILRLLSGQIIQRHLGAEYCDGKEA